MLLATACSADGADDAATPDDTAAADVVLRADGLSVIDVGSMPAQVIAELTLRFGGPDRDSGWIEPASAVYGLCPGAEMRAVGWGSFFALFSGDGSGDESGRWLTWTYGFDHEVALGGVDPRDLDLRTAVGIGLGSTRTDLRSAYGDRLEETGDVAIDIWGFEIDPGSQERVRGTLSGPGPEASVLFLERVPGCDDLEHGT